MIAWLSALPRRHAQRMVMVVMAMGQRSHTENDTRTAKMSLSIGFCLATKTLAE